VHSRLRFWCFSLSGPFVKFLVSNISHQTHIKKKEKGFRSLFSQITQMSHRPISSVHSSSFTASSSVCVCVFASKLSVGGIQKNESVYIAPPPGAFLLISTTLLVSIKAIYNHQLSKDLLI
jgi:hypothetical protein